VLRKTPEKQALRGRDSDFLHPETADIEKKLHFFRSAAWRDGLACHTFRMPRGIKHHL
jgi:hypothetical protein